jgi:hypothetical protein
MATSEGEGGTDFELKIVGLNELIRTMRKAGLDLTELKDAHHRAGEIVATEAAAIAPRRSGRLAGTIRAAKQVRRARVQVGRASVPYAGPIHWGWPSRNIEPQPFLSDAARSTEPQWRTEYQRAIEDALAQIKGA